MVGVTSTRIDWSSALVCDGVLTVELSPAPDKAWRRQAGVVIDRLAGSGRPWGKVKAKKRKLVAAGVSEGAEDELRHFLESVVLEANAAAPAAEHDAEDDDASGDDTDGRLTEAFRKYAAGEDAAPPAAP